MKQSFKLLSLFGIDINLHITFLVFIFSILILSPMMSLLLLIVFFYVTLHELAHSIVAMHEGIKVKQILLVPIGGMAMLSKTTMKPMSELKMALAGPLFNFTVVLLCYIIAAINGINLHQWLTGFLNDGIALSIPQLLLFYSFYANLVLGLFNLLFPAFPLDSGRIIRALLAMKMEYLKATRIAKNIGIIAGLALLVYGMIYTEWWLILISFFILVSANAEYEGTLVSMSLNKISISKLVRKDFLQLKEDEKIETALQKMVEANQTAALVGKKVLLFESAKTEKKTLAENAAVSVPILTINSRAEYALKTMMSYNVPMLPVAAGKKLIGIIAIDDLKKLVKIRSMKQ